MKKYPKKVSISIVLVLLFIIGCFLGCTKEEVKGQFQKVVGDVGSGGDGFQSGGIVTDTPPNAQNRHIFGETVLVENEATGVTSYTVTNMQSYDTTAPFSKNDFSERAYENGWLSENGALNPDYTFVVVEFTLKKEKNGVVLGEAELVNMLRLVYMDAGGQILPAGDMEYLVFLESDVAKRSENPNEFLGVYLDEGASVTCQVGYFVPKKTVNNTANLFFALGLNPEKTQYIYSE